MKHRNIALVLTVCCSVWLASTAQALPRAEPVPGGVAVIPLGAAERVPQARYQDDPVLVTRENGQWYAVVGLPLGAKPGNHQLSVTQDGKRSSVSFAVADKAYETQHITIKDTRKVNPQTRDLERIRAESARIKKALRAFSERAEVQTDFIWPADGPTSSPFGLRRFFNEQPRNPHSGLDIAAPEGAPIVAPAAGKVIEVGDFFFNGNTVFVDHGQGLVTMYCHMSRIDVQVGDEVRAGDRLGAIGKTGRVTGAHLHWGVSLNDARVDPLLFVPPRETSASNSAKPD